MTNRRLLLSPLWLIVALVTFIAGGASSAAANAGSETRVRANSTIVEESVGQPGSERPASVGRLRPETVATAVGSCVATEAAGPSFYRGAKPGEAPSFEPRPNDFKVDAATGTVKPTHGVSVFDNPGSVTSKGFVPHEVNLASVPSELQIIQRGANAAHYEIVPQVGANLTPEQYKGLMCQIVCKS